MTVKLPKNERTVFQGRRLAVRWLLVGGVSMPAKKEYEQVIDPDDADGSFRAIDRFLEGGKPVPKTLIDPLQIGSGMKVWAIKAPQRGKVIGRIYCYRAGDWDLYAVMCKRKRDQTVRDEWKKTMRERIRRSLASGGP